MNNKTTINLMCLLLVLVSLLGSCGCSTPRGPGRQEEACYSRRQCLADLRRCCDDMTKATQFDEFMAAEDRWFSCIGRYAAENPDDTEFIHEERALYARLFTHESTHLGRAICEAADNVISAGNATEETKMRSAYKASGWLGMLLEHGKITPVTRIAITVKRDEYSKLASETCLNLRREFVTTMAVADLRLANDIVAAQNTKWLNWKELGYWRDNSDELIHAVRRCDRVLCTRTVVPEEVLILRAASLKADSLGRLNAPWREAYAAMPTGSGYESMPGYPSLEGPAAQVHLLLARKGSPETREGRMR